MSRTKQAKLNLLCLACAVFRQKWSAVPFHWAGFKRALIGD
ncbi:MAG TPA: hypothetical protein VLT83_12295 [Opitutaceae bacterium]|nr:hypothetical protein [Opitutaceae bacterium]